jgi:hypothetical protein
MAREALQILNWSDCLFLDLLEPKITSLAQAQRSNWREVTGPSLSIQMLRGSSNVATAGSNIDTTLDVV